jgi:hypothetical protein
MSRYLFLLLALTFIAQCGCVRRRMTVRSNPDGAMVHVDNQPVGITPVSTAFTYYGTREIRLEKDGFETVNVKHKFKQPWWQIPPLDFFSENLWPWELRDEHDVNLQMVPKQFVPEKQLRQNAEQMRSGSRQGVATPIIVPPPQTLPAPRGAAPPIPESLPRINGSSRDSFDSHSGRSPVEGTFRP